MRKTTLILGLLLACLVLGGCGGGDEDGSEDGGTASARSGATTNELGVDEGSSEGKGGRGGESGREDRGGASGSKGSAAEGKSDAGSPGSGAASSIGKEEFVEEANAICERTSRKILAGVTALTAKANDSNRDAIEVKTVKAVFIPGLLGEIEQIRDLGLPEEGRSQVEAFLDATALIAQRAKRHPRTFDQQGNPYASAEERATRYGMTACPVSPVSDTG